MWGADKGCLPVSLGRDQRARGGNHEIKGPAGLNRAGEELPRAAGAVSETIRAENLPQPQHHGTRISPNPRSADPLRGRWPTLEDTDSSQEWEAGGGRRKGGFGCPFPGG